MNDDDPLTFATRLSDEFAYLYFALLRNGVSAHDALDWINRTREQGHSSRFTLAASRATGPDGETDWLDWVENPEQARMRSRVEGAEKELLAAQRARRLRTS